MIVLDTHIWIWWVSQSAELLKEERKQLINAASVVGVSAISCFEVAWLESHRRIVLSCCMSEWFDKALGGSGITLLPITPEIAVKAANLPEHHSDPQDRIIIATALLNNANLMSDDRKFCAYNEIISRLL